jgi:hypothetical protein
LYGNDSMRVVHSPVRGGHNTGKGDDILRAVNRDCHVATLLAKTFMGVTKSPLVPLYERGRAINVWI